MSKLPLFKVFMTEDLKLITQTLSSGMLTQGSKVEEFEAKLKKFFDYPYILTLNSATSGLTIALRLLNLPKNSQVLMNPLTCFADTCSVLTNDLSISWVDTDLKTCAIDLEDLQNKITPNTKAVLVTHWAGNPIDLDKLKSITGDIPIIEDCAHAFGAIYKNKYLGTSGNIAIYSLQAIKHLTTADGGLIFLPNEVLYNRAKMLRWYGIDREKKATGIDYRIEGDIPEWGYKFHMNDVNASIGLANLPHIKYILSNHIKNGNFYDSKFENLYGIEPAKQVPNAGSVYWVYTLKVKQKERFMKYMTENGITVSQVHKRNDTNSCVKQFFTKLPNQNKLDDEIVCIPSGWWVTPEDRNRIVKLVYDFSEMLELGEERQIRPLLAKDREAYISFFPYIKSDTFEDRLNEIRLNRAEIYVLEDKDVLLSTAKLYIEKKFEESVAHIEDVFTNPEHRKKGYASLLIKYIKKKAIQNGCYKIVLESSEQNVNFYEKNGFQKKGFQMVYNTK